MQPTNYATPATGIGAYAVLAINDLGMHCGDLDTRIASILPPFQVMLSQVVQRGYRTGSGTNATYTFPVLNPTDTQVFYSAAANATDPVLGSDKDGLKGDGSTFKTNFWDTVANGAYDAFYPGGMDITPLGDPGSLFPTTADKGLPVPNVEDLYIGPDGKVNSGDEFLGAVQHAMPGITNPYRVSAGGNVPQKAEEFYRDKPFFVNFPFGYVARNVHWFEAAGIPFSAFDDFGRLNAYPLVRVQATVNRQVPGASNVVRTVDTVLPISGEASCTNCHAQPLDYASATGGTSRSNQPTQVLLDAGLPVATSLDDPDDNMPSKVSLEYAADVNVLRLHDLTHGRSYVSTACDAPGQDCLLTAPEPCIIDADHPDGDSPSCLTQQALVQHKPVVCQVCHYTPALDLAQVGPKAGAEGNGRNQIAHKSNSNVMHSHHGSLGDLFPPIPAPVQAADGTVTNQAQRLTALENSCYQCHPGTATKCLRGAMFNGNMLCSDCHGATHAEWPNGNPNANDNVAARQMQGHTGEISDCGVCHGSEFDASAGTAKRQALKGPHAWTADGLIPTGARVTGPRVRPGGTAHRTAVVPVPSSPRRSTRRRGFAAHCDRPP